ncbi:Diphthamide biosynthesis protein 2 [Scheffersomyces amazonensis]|uniref:Diphthamide biosynthesis protein 2 n=1 Tax=Scheffersomyces amazonensis TaxID=1078765 RepID=UPI00315D1C2F
MTSEELVAPALSTYQDDTTFEFAQVVSEKNLRRHLNLKDPQDQTEIIDKINEYYSLEQVIQFLQQRGEDGRLKYKRVTLQFPDSLVGDSATIVHELQRRLGITCSSIDTSSSCNCNSKSNSNSECCQKVDNDNDNNSQSQAIWILADTSYSPCCVDEVAAEHVNSDLVIHFGDACLNIIDKLPVAYVLGKPQIDIEKLIVQFKQRFPVDEGHKIILMSDSPHTYLLRDLYNLLKDEYPHLLYTDLAIDNNSSATIIGYEPIRSNEEAFRILNRNIIGLNASSIDNEEDNTAFLQEYDLFHITKPETPRLLQLTTTFNSVTLFADGNISQGPFPNLMRRYRYMHMARSAGTVGLLVNTLSLMNTKKLINQIGQKIKQAGKKHYIFVVGKPNVAKLANFESIDMWCILGCDHQGIIIDQSNEYFKPIVTPYELLLALSDELTWTGKWITDFNSILRNLSNEEEEEEEKEEEPRNNEQQEEDKPPVFDPVTGTFVSTSQPLRQINHLSITAEEEQEEDSTNSSNSLVKKFSATIAIKNTVSTSAVHLQNRHWTGLGSDFNTEDGEGEEDGNEQGAILEEGRGGIARGYDYDNSLKKHS